MATINSWNSNNPAEVAKGGTGQSTLTIHGVLIGNSTSGITQLAAAATGATLMGSTGADPAFTGSPSFSGSVTAGTTITASSGAITATSGNVVITAGNLTLPATTSSSLGSLTIGGNRFLHAYGATADANTFVGLNAGNYTLTSGTATNNTGIGQNALIALTTGINNTACGVIALNSITTGGNNACFGYGAGSAYTSSEANNTCLGFNVIGVAAESNTIRIGNTSHTKCFIIGVSGIVVTGAAAIISAGNQLGVLASSERFKENIVPMADNPIMQLRPVNFTYKEGEDKSKQYGLIAEEVYKLMPELVVLDKEGLPFTVNYHLMPAILLNEIQKLRKEVNSLRGI